MTKERVLIIDDLSNRTSVLASSLTNAGYEVLVVPASDENELQHSYYYYHPHYLVIDNEFVPHGHQI